MRLIPDQLRLCKCSKLLAKLLLEFPTLSTQSEPQPGNIFGGQKDCILVLYYFRGGAK